MMARRCVLLLPALALAACSPPSGTPAPQRIEDLAMPASPEDAIMMSEINLRLYAKNPIEGLSQKPAFWLQAQKFAMREENTWEVEDARAVVYGEQAGEESIVFEARRGRFEEGKSAYLKDGVTARIGDMRLELSDIVYEIPEDAGAGVAYSSHPVKVDDPALQLQAASVRLDSGAKTFVLTEVAGYVRFEGVVQ